MALKTPPRLQRTYRPVPASWPNVSWWHLLRRVFITGALAGGTLSCAGDTTGPTLLSPAQTYWALRLNVHAANMATIAPYNTLQLIATPRNMAGDSLSGFGPATYTAADSNVTVSPTGLVTTRYPTRQTFVFAALQDQVRHVTHADTVFVQVTDTIPQHALTTFSIHPVGGDSAKRAAGSDFSWPLYAFDAVGDTLCTARRNFFGILQTRCALQVFFTSSEPAVAQIDRNNGTVFPHRPGHVTFYATTLAYGVAKHDSLPVTIGWPVVTTIQSVWITPVASLTPVLSFNPPKIFVGVGADVAWQDGDLFNQNPVGDSVDVVFDDSTAVQPGCGVIFGRLDCPLFPPTDGGNIPPFKPDTAALNAGDYATYGPSVMQGRTFPMVGTYTYHSRRYPSATGQIIVKTDP